MRNFAQSARCGNCTACHISIMKTLATFMTLLVVSCASVASPRTISVDTAAKLVAEQPELQILDVRRPDEFMAGHLKGATPVTWGDADFEKQALNEISKDKPVLVYCRSGRRSTAATEALAGLGFTKLHNLEGGITAWQAAGKPVVK